MRSADGPSVLFVCVHSAGRSQGLDAVRRIRDEIERRVKKLADELSE